MAVPGQHALGCDSWQVTAPTLPPPSAEPADGVNAGRTESRVKRSPRKLGSRLRAVARGARPSGRAPSWLMGAVAGLWAAAIGLCIAVVPMLVAWMASPDTGLTWTESLRLGGLLWVIAHGVPVALGGVTVTLLPWGLVLVPLLLLGYAGGWAARRLESADTASLARLIATGTGVYAVAVGVVASLTAEPESRTTWWVAVLHAAVIAAAALSWGALRASGVRPLDRIPLPVATAIRAGLVSAAALVGFGALAATASLLAHFDLALTMAQSLEAGLGGGLALAALGVAFAPVMAVWGTAYVMGAGVVIAPSVTLTPFVGAAAPTDLPPFPLLAALPQGATPLAWLLPLTGVLAGVLGGLLIGRRARREPRLTRLAIAGGAAVVAGAVLAVAAVLASGALGEDRLASLGPVPMTVGILGAVLVVLGAVPSAVAPSGPERPSLIVASSGPRDTPADIPDPIDPATG